MNKKLTKEEFISRSKSFPRIEKINIDYIYQVYDLAFDGIIELLDKQNLVDVNVDSFEVISYILGEYIYSTEYLSEEGLEKFLKNESFLQSMASVSADKYLSLSIYNHRENRFTNYYLPPISSTLYFFNQSSFAGF